MKVGLQNYSLFVACEELAFSFLKEGGQTRHMQSLRLLSQGLQVGFDTCRACSSTIASLSCQTSH